MKNVCTGCGIETDEEYCPNGCVSIHDSSQPKPTLPWSQVPKNCWTCGQPIETPPHLRRYMGQCENCVNKQLGKVN